MDNLFNCIEIEDESWQTPGQGQSSEAGERHEVVRELTCAVLDRSYSRAYALLRRIDREHIAMDDADKKLVLLSAIFCTLRLFQTIYEQLFPDGTDEMMQFSNDMGLLRWRISEMSPFWGCQVEGSLLLIAAANDRPEHVRYLLSKGYNANGVPPHEQDPTLPTQTIFFIQDAKGTAIPDCTPLAAAIFFGAVHMYLLLPMCMVCLFSLLLDKNRGECRKIRGFSAAMYVLHPLCIVLVRGAAKVLGLEEWLVGNSLLHFVAVLALSALLSAPCLLRVRKKPSPTARAWREVDLAALGHNARVLRDAVDPGTELMAVVKAEAYGHGGAVTARALQRAGVRAFAVACLTEGIALRKAGIRGTILILGYTAPEEAPLLTRWRLTQAVADIDHGRALAAQGRRVHVHLALDTGMHRLGIPAENREEILEVFRLPNLVVDGVFSHLCVSDSLEAGDVAYTQEQLTLFYDTVAWLRAGGYDPGKVHIQASYGLWNLPKQPCAYVRAGIALYGVRSDDAPVQRSLDLRPVLSLRARVASVRTLSAGESAGYGRAFRAEQETRLAVVTIGYADGLPRDLAQRGGQVLIRGRRCPMVGRMCMDQLLVDASGLPDVSPGDVATVIGRDGGQTLRAEEVAARCGTITNELLSRLGDRLPGVSGGRVGTDARP